MERKKISNKEIPWQCPPWISLEVGYYFLLKINGEKTLLGDLKKKKKKECIAEKLGERSKKTSSHRKHSTYPHPLTSSDCPEPGTLPAAPDWRKMLSRVIKISQISKKPPSSQSPGGYWIVQGVEVRVEGCGQWVAPSP